MNASPFVSIRKSWSCRHHYRDFGTIDYVIVFIWMAGSAVFAVAAVAELAVGHYGDAFRRAIDAGFWLFATIAYLSLYFWHFIATGGDPDRGRRN